jgi:hypothetical protein
MMIDFRFIDRYGEILYCVKIPSVFLESIYQINRAKAQENLHSAKISEISMNPHIMK